MAKTKIQDREKVKTARLELRLLNSEKELLKQKAKEANMPIVIYILSKTIK